MMESVESRDMFQLHIVCKDSKIVRCHFSTFKQCQDWLKRLSRAIARPTKPEDLFAFAYHAWCLGVCADEEDQHAHLCRPGDHVKYRFEMELARMGFDLQNVWRVSDINKKYKLCTSYPQKLLVPVWITDKELENVASFRSWKRVPVVVYRHQRNGAVIARCSQPEISWWGWRNADDEYLVTSIAKACALNPGQRLAGGTPHSGLSDGNEACDAGFDSSLTACSSVERSATPQKLLILDARSYTAAVANRAKGGGCECEEYYSNCEVVFMGMANIHSIRNSFQYLRAVCSQMPDPSNWLSALESTKWLQHLSIMLKAAVLVSTAVGREGRPVLVHCSDGWDRTPQIVALAKILLDPYYRTMEGFQVLVESDWLDFGHKFGDRCGHQEKAEDQTEQCPVFLQWLDSVHQLQKQFPCLFEFNEAFLVKLVQHTYSCLYGTFLGNSPCERETHNIAKRTCSVWSLLRAGNKNFHNLLYVPGNEQVLHPVCHVRALHLWTAVYLPASSPCPLGEEGMHLYLPSGLQSQEFGSTSLDRLPKTRSMDDLLSACDPGSLLIRTSSDPNLNNHCQDVRVGLEPRHPSAEESVLGKDSTAEEPPPGWEWRQQQEHHPLQVDGGGGGSSDGHGADQPQALQGRSLSQQFSGPSPESGVLSKANPGAAEDSCPAADASGQKKPSRDSTQTEEPFEKPPCSFVKEVGPESSGVWDLVEPCHPETLLQPPAVAPSWNPSAPGAPKQDPAGCRGEEVDGRKGSIRCGEEEASRAGKAPPEWWRKGISQSQMSEFSLLGTNWDSFQGLGASLPGSDVGPQRLLSYGCCNKRWSSRHLWAAGLCLSGQWPLKEAVKTPSCSSNPGTRCASLAGKPSRLRPPCHLKQTLGSRLVPPSSPSPVPPLYLDDDGLPFPTDVIQHRLRQIEATYKQEVEQLRRQVRELQLRLDARHCYAPPAEPQVDYEDDFTCLKESDGSENEDFYSDHSEECLSEASWEPVDKRETEVTRWVPDHMASHCFNCDCEFWLAKRRHHCRNCGNVFCAGCCHLKLPIPDQQLYDPVLVCNSCYDHIQMSRARELLSQHLKKPIATASS
ncbi:myotubularin-related protein 4 isoform X2 [Varanus komodoensis]|nr:myotubularin-related protein 4 isoform X2 [Varanus komodoensis]